MLLQDLDKITSCAERIGKAHSQSWLGYHSVVYYSNLQPPPSGAHFSIEWGLMDTIVPETTGDWKEYTYDQVVNAIMKCAGNPELSKQEQESAAAKDVFDEAKSEVLSLITIFLRDNANDEFIMQLKSQTDKENCYSQKDFIDAIRPRGQTTSRDSTAILSGLVSPPHIVVLARVSAIKAPFIACDRLEKIARRAGSHLENLAFSSSRSERIGTKVFIGHGRAKLWKELKDFVSERLHLPWDEFNRIPVAGLTNIARLSEMLHDAAIAFLILTAEDEQIDETYNPRLNVVHEAGLFQGRLGFERAIILLEEGCKEFSNIHGLGQIRFPKGNISAVFEEIRRVLEREGIIE